jgi:hypothetical protein
MALATLLTAAFILGVVFGSAQLLGIIALYSKARQKSTLPQLAQSTPVTVKAMPNPRERRVTYMDSAHEERVAESMANQATLNNDLDGMD